MEKIAAFCAGVKMTLVGAIFLAVSLYLDFTDQKWPVDPAWATVLISGIPLLYLAITRLINNKGMKKISSALLITIAMLAAIFIGDIFAAGEVAFIMAIGAILEEKTTERAQRGLRKLLNLVPKKGRKLVDGKEFFVNVEDIKIGDILRVLPGETVPADGTIISGSTSVDQAVLTGESLPVDKKAGDKIWCGTINRFGAVDMKAARASADSSLQQMIRLVKEAEKAGPQWRELPIPGPAGLFRPPCCLPLLRAL